MIFKAICCLIIVLLCSYDDVDVQRITSSLICGIGRGEGEKVCYVLEVDEKEKLVPVSDSLTHIFRSLYGEEIC